MSDSDSPENQRPSTARAAAGMGAITALSRFMGFVRVLVVLLVLGTTALGNAFNSANMLSNVLFELLAAGALSGVLVPTFVNLLERGDRKGAEDVAGGVLGMALLVLGGVTVLGVVTAPWLARVLTQGADPATLDDQRELVTYLLRFFLPQVMLYAAGTIATAVLHAKRKFVITAAAPIGNTVVMVLCLLAFRLVAGPDPGLDLSDGERWLLIAAATGGVVAFVVPLLAACASTGFRLRPRWPGGDQRIMEALAHSGWGVALHTVAGMLLGAAVIAGNAVDGGVAAYQFAWVVFLAPYGIIGQPIHTAVLPELVTEAREEGPTRVVESLRWAMERLALLVLPVMAAMMALALPAMRLIKFGEITDDGVGLLAAALVGLAVGLYAYSAMLLLARGYYALGDSRTPGLVALASGVVGVAVMFLGALFADGAALVAVLGLGHSVAYILGALVLARGLVRLGGAPLWSPVLVRVAGVAVVAGSSAWLVSRVVLGTDPDKLADLSVLVGGGLLGGLVIGGGYRLLGVMGDLTAREPLTRQGSTT
jgi:putative peptidoglycan lipid II flippase